MREQRETDTNVRAAKVPQGDPQLDPNKLFAADDPGESGACRQVDRTHRVGLAKPRTVPRRRATLFVSAARRLKRTPHREQASETAPAIPNLPPAGHERDEELRRRTDQLEQQGEEQFANATTISTDALTEDPTPRWPSARPASSATSRCATATKSKTPSQATSTAGRARTNRASKSAGSSRKGPHARRLHGAALGSRPGRHAGSQVGATFAAIASRSTASCSVHGPTTYRQYQIEMAELNHLRMHGTSEGFEDLARRSRGKIQVLRKPTSATAPRSTRPWLLAWRGAHSPRNFARHGAPAASRALARKERTHGRTVESDYQGISSPRLLWAFQSPVIRRDRGHRPSPCRRRRDGVGCTVVVASRR